MKASTARKLKFSFKIDEIALVFLVAFIIIMVTAYGKLNQPAIGPEKITDLIMNNKGVSFVDNGVLNENTLNKIQDMDYDAYKASLNLKDDFCVYLEDENGNIILSKGSSKLDNGDIVCRE